MKGLKRLKECTTYEGEYLIDFFYHKKREVKMLPTKTLKCNKPGCYNDKVKSIAGCYLRNGKPGYVCYCEKCDRLTIAPYYSFEETKRMSNLDFSVQATQKRILKLKGFEDEDIEEIEKLYEEDWAKEEKARQIRMKNEAAERAENWREIERKREASSFKEKLAADIYKYDTTARAFYDTTTGVVVRKL